MTSPEETNAKVLEDIAALTQRCYGLLACIDAKGEVRGFEYICRVFREPRAGGVRVPVTFDGTLVNAVGGAHASAAHVPLPAASASASAHAAGLFGTPAPQGWGILGPQAAPFAFQAGQHLAWPAGGQVNGSRGVGLSASSVVEIDTPSLRLIECAVSRPSKVVLERAPPFNLGIEAVADIFNDKLDYTCVLPVADADTFFFAVFARNPPPPPTHTGAARLTTSAASPVGWHPSFPSSSSLAKRQTCPLHCARSEPITSVSWLGLITVGRYCKMHRPQVALSRQSWRRPTLPCARLQHLVSTLCATTGPNFHSTLTSRKPSFASVAAEVTSTMTTLWLLTWLGTR